MRVNATKPTNCLATNLAMVLLINGWMVSQHSHASPVDSGDKTTKSTAQKIEAPQPRLQNRKKKEIAREKKSKGGMKKLVAEQAALRLVDTHVPQLTLILQNLKQDSPAAYQKAVFDLSRSARRLDAIAKRDQELLPIEIELLQFRIEADLRTAKLKVRDNKEDRQALRTALTSYHETILKRIQHETKVLQARLEKTQQQMATVNERLAEKETHLQKNIDQAFQKHLRKAGRHTRTKKTGANNNE